MARPLRIVFADGLNYLTSLLESGPHRSTNGKCKKQDLTLAFGRGELDGVDQTIIAALSVTLAYLSYSFIEKPFRAKRIDLASPVWRYSVAVASIFVVAVAMHMHESDGWTWRVSYPVDLRHAGDAKVFHKEFYGGAGYPNYGPVNTEKAADIVVMGDSHGGHYAEGMFKVIAQPYPIFTLAP